MSHFIRIILLLFISSFSSQAQILKGKITNPSGEPIQYATVYIQELRQGTTSNTRGDYEIRLPAGKYTVTYQSLGFAPLFINLTLSDKTVIKNIELPLQYYEIPEVRITASGEDPAYIIMRKVIGLAPYYLNNISYYKAEVYLKGNLLINKIPKLLRKSFKIESNDNGATVSGGGKKSGKERVIKEGESFLMESYNEMEFTAPDKYFQRVISYNSTFPQQGNEISPMDFIQASFYQPVLADMAISPLSPQAFSHYNFKYLGASLQGNYTINKIQVIPKRKSQQLFEGTIYIIEDLWCLHSVDLTNENLIGKIRVQQLYIPVQDEVWMPVSHKFEINISIVGFRADAGYGSSVKYIEVKPNLTLHKPESISTNNTGRQSPSSSKQDSLITKGQQSINKILEKDQLSNRDMIRLARLMEKESEKSISDSSKKSLEVTDNTTHVIEKDAAEKDTAYWAEIRPIPLSDIEIRSLRVSDSIKVASLKEIKNDTIQGKGKKEKSKFITALSHIGFGHTWSDTTGLSFTNGGLAEFKNLNFNTVDGFNYGVNFRFSKTWHSKRSISVFPEFRWAFSREKLLWRINANYRINGLKPGLIFLRTGQTSKDIGSGGGINPFINSITSLLMKKNYIRLYESGYLTIGYRGEITNGLTLELSTGYEVRKVLQNTTDFSFIKTAKAYSENIPYNSYLLPGSNPLNELQNQRHADFITRITYTPKQKYRFSKGNKSPEGSDWPTFNLTWQHGINEFQGTADEVRHFDMVRFEAHKNTSIGAFGNFRWRLSVGGYLDNRDLTFYDFFHFNPQPLPLLLNDYEDAFMIPGFYTLSTPEFYQELHMKYTTPYLLLKLLPGLSNTLIRENVSLSYLGSRFHTNYTEVGYSLSEIFFLAELGVYAGFDDLRYKSIGAKLILRFN
jgi:hypothetical protein